MCAPGQFHLVAEAHSFDLLGCCEHWSPSVSAVPAGFSSADVICPIVSPQSLTVMSNGTGSGLEL